MIATNIRVRRGQFGSTRRSATCSSTSWQSSFGRLICAYETIRALGAGASRVSQCISRSAQALADRRAQCYPAARCSARGMRLYSIGSRPRMGCANDISGGDPLAASIAGLKHPMDAMHPPVAMAHMRMNVLIGTCLALSIGCSGSEHRGNPASGAHTIGMDAGAGLRSRARPQVRSFAPDSPSPTGRIVPSRDASTPEFGDAGRDPLDTVVVLPDPGDLDYAETTIKLKANGVSQRLRFKVPGDAWSFVATANSTNPTIRIALESLVGPDGTMFPTDRADSSQRSS